MLYPRRLFDHPPDEWKRAALAAVILDRINTWASRDQLLKLAGGHPDALPTRTAVALIRARFALPSPHPDPGWAKLLDCDPIQCTRWAFELADHPERVRALKAKLAPIKATQDEVTTWLKALNSDKAEVWKPAFEKLLYFRPSLALELQAQCDLMTTDHGRAAFYHLCSSARSPPDELTILKNSTLTISQVRLVVFDTPNRDREDTVYVARVDPPEELNPAHWKRARIAVLALQRVNTPAAKAVLKQLADGHPDILPTREAKAALR